MKVRIVCDHCDWKNPGRREVSRSDLGMKCPDCGAEVVNETDLLLAESLNRLEAQGVIRDTPIGEEGTGKRFSTRKGFIDRN